MKIKKMIVSILVFSLLACTLGVNSKEAFAASHTQSEAVSWAVAQIGKGLDYDGVYGNQCVDLIKYYYAYFGVAGYATGNANAYITNSLPSGWTRVYSGYQPGDIAVWKVNHSCSTCSTGAYGHVGIITSADSTGFNAVNQNYSGTSSCTQNWFYCSALACAIRPSFTTAAPAVSVTFQDFNQNGIWETNAEMYIKVMNPSKATVSAVGCYLYNANGSLLKSYSESCSYNTSYVNYTCNINSDMKYTLQPGTTYKYMLYAVVGGKEYKDVTRTFTTSGSSDKEKPVISDMSVYDVTENGYKVKCKATDNVGVDRVQFPTWTVADEQDDIQPSWGTNSAASGKLGIDGYYVYEVKISDHNNERGAYITHIYAYDKAGNSVACAAPTVTIEEDGSESPSSSDDNSTQKANGAALATVAQKEYDAYAGQSYNYQYGTSPWCCNFVSWCARQAGISTDVITSTETVQTMYDRLINDSGAEVVSKPQRGDLVFYKYTDYDSEKFHHIGIMISGTETIQGNVNNTWWRGKPDGLNNIKQIVYVRPAYNDVYVAPASAYFDGYNLNKTEDHNAEVYIKIQNPNREGVTAVGCELYDRDGTLLDSYSETCSYTTSYVNYTCNFISDMGYTLSPGTEYKFRLYAVVGGKRIEDSIRSFTTTTTAAGSVLAAPGESTEPGAQSVPRKETADDAGEEAADEISESEGNVSTAIAPGKVTLKKVRTLKKGKMKATWKWFSNQDGFQVQYAQNSRFTKKSRSKNVGTYSSSVTLKRLGHRKVYYVRVRAYKKSGSGKIYGKWSRVIKRRVK